MQFRVWGIAAISLLSTVSTAHAVFNCATNPVTSVSDIQATQNFETNSTTTPCITLQNGYDLDLNGFSIICTNPTGCADAVKGASGISPGQSVVGPGTISGKFARAISGLIEEVRGITIDGATIGMQIQRTNKVHKNVLINVPEEGIIAVLTGAALDSIDNNFISLSGTTGDGAIVVSGGTTSGNGSKIEKNYIENYGIGLRFIDGTKFRVNNNMLGDRPDMAYGASDPVNVGAFGAGKTFSGNLCTDPTYCPDPTTPFVLP